MTTAPDFDPHGLSDEERRIFLAGMATNRGLLAELAEGMGEDIVPYAIQAIAMELVQTSIAVQELQERIGGVDTVIKPFGRLMGGLLGLGSASMEVEENDPDSEDEEKYRIFCDLAWCTGNAIRGGAGLAPLEVPA